jgi:hypothetical protein
MHSEPPFHLSQSFPELKVDTGRSMAVPTITVEDHDGEKSKVVAKHTTESPQEVVEVSDDHDTPGSMPANTAAAIPDWYRVGWRQNSGLHNIQEGEEKIQSLLDTYLHEQFYGDWYHNAAVIVFVRITQIFLPSLLIIRSVGSPGVPFPDPLWFWVGLAIYYPGVLQHVLLHIYDAH